MSWTASAYNGGSAITSYKVICDSTNGGTLVSGTTAGTTAAVGSVTLGKDYTCSVWAINVAGQSYPGTELGFTIV